MVQLLGFCAFMSEGPGSVPGQRTKNPEAAQHSQKKQLVPKKCRRDCPFKSCNLYHEKLSLNIIFQKRVSLLVVLVSIFPTSDESQTLTTKRMHFKNGSLISSNIIAF